MYIELVMPSNYLIINYKKKLIKKKKLGSVSFCLSSVSVISFPPLRQEETQLLEAFWHPERAHGMGYSWISFL